MTDGQRQTIASKGYASLTQVFFPTGIGQELILPRDPRRFFVQFRVYAGPSAPHVYAGLLPSNAILGLVTSDERTYKWHDCPGIVTGEWYVFTNDAFTAVEIVTDTYIGE